MSDTVVTVSIRSVSQLSPDELECITSSGTMLRISLPLCAKRFSEAHSAGTSGQCIGIRRIDGQNDYLLLYAEPPVRIECSSGVLRRRKDMSLLRAS